MRDGTRVERLSRRGALSRGQVHDLLAAAERHGVPYGLCCVLAVNGPRMGEATRLNLDDLDCDGLCPVADQESETRG